MLTPVRPLDVAMEEATRGFSKTQTIRKISLHDFVREAWHVLEPGTEFLDNWHIGAMVEHLEALTEGDIQNLIINIPPRCMKSLLVSAFWQPWVWTFHPESRWMFASYDSTLSQRDTVKSRNVIKSDWYQYHWGSMFQLAADQNLKSRYENTRTGLRLATSVEGKGTGEGGHYIVVDDPHKAADAHRPRKLDTDHQWWKETMSTRSDVPGKLKRLIVMQRIAENDLTGRMLEQGNYVHLCIPQEYEPKIFDVLPKGLPNPTGYADPRTEPGELLWESRFSRDAVEQLKVDLGPYGYAAQETQLPAPVGGGIVKKDWIRTWGKDIPRQLRPEEVVSRLELDRMQIHVDTRFKEDPSSGSYVVVAVWGRKGTRVYLLDVYRERVGYIETKQAIRDMVRRWPMVHGTYIERKASGDQAIQELSKELPGIVSYEVKNDNKISRLEARTSYFHAGNVYFPTVLQVPSIDVCIAELTTFPFSANDDFVDTCSQALECLYDTSDIVSRFRTMVKR